MHEWQSRLLEWYDTNRRDLPWRGVRSPYLVWVSETILQQTRVAQGTDYYLRFISRFPTLEALAEADEDEVLRLWQGLGYYSRARNMHAAARKMVAAGGFPRRYEDVWALPGVGPYTAAAVCSLAYGDPVAVVDGNVYRVLSRYFALDTPIDTSAGKREFAALAGKLLDRSCPADYNQALMDFGALQCVPSSPDCGGCPLRDGCLAAGRGEVANFPVRARTQSVAQRHLCYLVVTSPDALWLRRREGGIWRGLYEPPVIESEKRIKVNDALKSRFASTLPPDFTLRTVARGVRHRLTHLQLVADCYEIRCAAPLPPPPEGFVAVPRERVGDYALPRLVEKLLARTLEAD